MVTSSLDYFSDPRLHGSLGVGLAALVGGWLFSGLALRTTSVTAGDEALRSLLFLFAFQPPELPLSLFSLGLAAHVVCICSTDYAQCGDAEDACWGLHPPHRRRPMR